MSHIIEEYSKNLGVKISKPVVAKHYWPIMHEKYITVSLDSKTPSKNYKYYDIVIDMVKNVLASRGFKIVQIGSSESQRIQNADDRIFDLSFKQYAYIISKSSLHVGVDGVLSHYASSIGIPLVTIFGNVFANVSRGYWSNNAENIEAPWKVKPSLSAVDPLDSINKIRPEEIANSIFKQLKIGGFVPLKTKFIGEYYENQVIEIVPNYFRPDESLKQKHVFMRPDFGFDNESFMKWMGFLSKFSIFSRQELPLELVHRIKGKLQGVSYIIDSKCSIPESHLKDLQSLGVPVALLVENESEISEIREKYFDFTVHLYLKADKKLLEGLDINFEKAVFNSSKVILANGRQYVSKYHFLKDENFVDKNFNLEDNEALLEELNHFFIYERTN